MNRADCHPGRSSMLRKFLSFARTMVLDFSNASFKAGVGIGSCEAKSAIQPCGLQRTNGQGQGGEEERVDPPNKEPLTEWPSVCADNPKWARATPRLCNRWRGREWRKHVTEGALALVFLVSLASRLGGSSARCSLVS